MRAITTFLVMVAMLGVGLLIAVATLDPLAATVTGYDLNGMDTQVGEIHEVLVKYMVPAGMASMVLWAVFRILRTERQNV